MRLLNISLALALSLALSACGRSPLASTAAPNPGMGTLGLEAGKLPTSRALIYNTIAILGIGPVYEAKLSKEGIKTIAQLLDLGGSRSQRARLAKASGISEKLLLTWVNHSDLMRITGCGPEYSRLLEAAGVDTVMELSRRDAGHLAAAMLAANDLGGGKVAVKRLPSVDTTASWIANAKSFDRKVSY